MRRLISLLLIISIVVSCFAVSALAADDDYVWFDLLSNTDLYQISSNGSTYTDSLEPSFGGSTDLLYVRTRSFLPIITGVRLTFRANSRPSSVSLTGASLTYVNSPALNTYTYFASGISRQGTFPQLEFTWSSKQDQNFRLVAVQYLVGDVSSVSGTLRYLSQSQDWPSSASYISLSSSSSSVVTSHILRSTLNYPFGADYFVVTITYIDMRDASERTGPGFYAYHQSKTLPVELVASRFDGHVGINTYKVDLTSVTNRSSVSFSFMCWSNLPLPVDLPFGYAVTNAVSGNVFRDVIRWINNGFNAVLAKLDSLFGSNGVDTSGAADISSGVNQMDRYDSVHQDSINSGFSDISSTSSILAFVPGLAFVSSFLTSVFGTFGDFQFIYTLPLLIAFIFFLCSRAPGAARAYTRRKSSRSFDKGSSPPEG